MRRLAGLVLVAFFMPSGVAAQSPEAVSDLGVSRAEGIAWAQSIGGGEAEDSPLADGQARRMVSLPTGTVELIGPEDALTQASWFGDSEVVEEWSGSASV